jgi:S-adenosylmethionine decarboxylase
MSRRWSRVLRVRGLPISSVNFSGTHLLADLFGCTGLDDIDQVEVALRAAVTAAGATLLEIRLHSFGAGQGVTGVALLAESHISIHTWPERTYAAIDIFLCGESNDLDAALTALILGLGAERHDEHRIPRGFSAALGSGAH